MTARCMLGCHAVTASKLMLVVVLTQVWARTAGAVEDARDAARNSYAHGLELAGEGAYEAALAEFKEAYRISPHFAVLYNIGQAQVALGRPLEAIETLSRFLRDGQEQVPRARREQVEAQIALLDSVFAELTITTDRPGARISIDGREVGRTPLYQQVRLAAGTHKIAAAFDGSSPVTRTVTLTEGERQLLNLEVPVTAAPEPSSARSPAHGPPSLGVDDQQPALGGGSRTKSIVGYVVVAAGVAVGGAAFAIYLGNRSLHDEWQANDALLQRDKAAPDYRDRQIANNQLADSLSAANGIIATLAVASGALLTTGVTLLVLNRAPDSRQGEAGGGSPISLLKLDWAWQGPGSAAAFLSGAW